MSLCAAAWGDQSVTLAWTGSSDPSVAGYFLNFGTKTGSYPSQINVGTNTTARVPGLKEGVTYHFVVTAYDSYGMQSDPSNEAVYITPGLLLLSQPAKSGNPVNLTFPVAPAHWYEVQATKDLKAWATIWQTTPATSNAWVQFADPQTSAFQNRYYRLVMH
jgi:hypothetical protein